MTGSVSLVLVLVREWLTAFPIVRLATTNGYEAENELTSEGSRLLAGAWIGVRVKNWSSRPVEIIARGLIVDDEDLILFHGTEKARVSTVGAWSTHTFRVPLVDVLEIPGRDVTDRTAKPWVTTSEAKRIVGGRALVIGSDLRYERDELLRAISRLQATRPGQPVLRHRAHVYGVTEAFVLGQRDPFRHVETPE